MNYIDVPKNWESRYCLIKVSKNNNLYKVMYSDYLNNV